MSTERKESKKPLALQTFGELFKKQVVKKFEQGLFTKAELRRRYNIRGTPLALVCLQLWCSIASSTYIN